MHFALPFCSASANVVALEEVLSAYDDPFRIAVQETLLVEGFELSSRLPNLQLARDIQEALGGALVEQGYGAPWESLQYFLEWAEHQGILVDLSLEPSHLPAIA